MVVTDLVGPLGDELPLVAVEHDVEQALRVERRPADEERDDHGRCKAERGAVRNRETENMVDMGD